MKTATISYAELRARIEAYLLTLKDSSDNVDPQKIHSNVRLLAQYLKTFLLPSNQSDLYIMPSQITFEQWRKNVKEIEKTTRVTNDYFIAWIKTQDIDSSKVFDNKFFLYSPAAKIFEGFIYTRLKTRGFDDTRKVLEAIETKLDEIKRSRSASIPSSSPARMRSLSEEAQSSSSSSPPASLGDIPGQTRERSQSGPKSPLPSRQPSPDSLVRKLSADNIKALAEREMKERIDSGELNKKNESPRPELKIPKS